MIWEDGRKYSGSFQMDMPHGKGVMDWPDGRRYDGFWLNGRQDGLGCFMKNKDVKMYGKWKNGNKQAWLKDTQYFAELEKLEKLPN